MKKHTQGEWIIKNESHIVSENGDSICSVWITKKSEEYEIRNEGESWIDMRLRTEGLRKLYTKLEPEANAKLIVDAGNTTNKCRLLPSELLEQRDEMLEVCKDLKQLKDWLNTPLDKTLNEPIPELISIVNKAEQAIKKATE